MSQSKLSHIFGALQFLPADVVSQIVRTFAAITLQRLYRQRFTNRYRQHLCWLALEQRVCNIGGAEALHFLKHNPRVVSEWYSEPYSWIETLDQPNAAAILGEIIKECRNGMWSVTN